MSDLNKATKGRKKLYGAWMYHGARRRTTLMHVSHNPLALRRNFPDSIIFEVVQTQTLETGIPVYDRVNKTPIEVTA